MTAVASALALHGSDEPSGVARWSTSAIVVAAIHAGLIFLAVAWYTSNPPQGTPIPPILIDLSPASAAAESQELDLAPGPEMQQADAPTPEPPKQEIVEETIAPTPPQENPVVAAPPEERPKPEPTTVKPTPVIEQVKKPPVKQPPAPRTTAAPRAERRAAVASASALGAASSAAALPDYRARLAAHLQRFKQYPAGARASGDQGVATLSFTVSRSGQVLSARLAGSSGSGALDGETMAMIRRAQPLPSFPPEITQSQLNFTVPIRFSLR